MDSKGKALDIMFHGTLMGSGQTDSWDCRRGTARTGLAQHDAFELLYGEGMISKGKKFFTLVERDPDVFSTNFNKPHADKRVRATMLARGSPPEKVLEPPQTKRQPKGKRKAATLTSSAADDAAEASIMLKAAAAGNGGADCGPSS